MSNNEIVQKLWNLCDVLRDDGINYSDYVTELVLLLFIKMEHENAQSGVMAAHRLPEGARWWASIELNVETEAVRPPGSLSFKSLPMSQPTHQAGRWAIPPGCVPACPEARRR